MITFNTKRLICRSDLVLVDQCLTQQINTVEIDVMNITPCTGREHAFCFYDKQNSDVLICHIAITDKRGRFEVSYGTEESFRGNGYMTEALESLCKWLFINTDRDSIWALPNGQYKKESISVLKKCGFQKADEEFGIEWYELKKR